MLNNIERQMTDRLKTIPISGGNGKEPDLGGYGEPSEVDEV